MGVIGTAIVLALAFQAVESAEASSSGDEQTLAAFLWYDHPINKGKMACDKSTRSQQEAFFNRRYKKRIERLKKAYEAENGADPGLEVIPALRCVSDRGLVRSAFAQGMSEFEVALERMEQRFGLVR
ncbi:hypothetical protein [Sphingopyxis panaciterrae]